MPFTIEQLNKVDLAEFIRIVGPVFEHSPWIAEMTSAKRPFANIEQLHQALCHTARAARHEQQLALIRAHPDLVGRAALAGTLTRSAFPADSHDHAAREARLDERRHLH